MKKWKVLFNNPILELKVNCEKWCIIMQFILLCLERFLRRNYLGNHFLRIFYKIKKSYPRNNLWTSSKADYNFWSPLKTSYRSVYKLHFLRFQILSGSQNHTNSCIIIVIRYKLRMFLHNFGFILSSKCHLWTC
jgi:hypothetical protein